VRQVTQEYANERRKTGDRTFGNAVRWRVHAINVWLWVSQRVGLTLSRPSTGYKCNAPWAKIANLHCKVSATRASL